MRICLLLVVALVLPIFCHAQEKDFSVAVDPWQKKCDETACTLTLLKDIKGAKAESDYFALGFAVSAKTQTPDYFVFSFPPTPVRSQVVVSLVQLEKLATGFATKITSIASFGTDPCVLRRDCKLRFNRGVLPEFRIGGFKEMNVWKGLKTHPLVDVSQTFEIDGVRQQRTALISLAAFQDVTREFLFE